MKIEHYSFGKIIVDGKIYASDIIIYHGNVDASWWRKDARSLHASDLLDIINARPEILIVGTGFFGVMTVPEETIKFITSRGIEIRVERTGKAVELYTS
ncbi:MAG: MTH938/NDUFAF3 family protein [Dissulfurispiraceae bacterium]|jgi:hypothetical protein